MYLQCIYIDLKLLQKATPFAYRSNVSNQKPLRLLRWEKLKLRGKWTISRNTCNSNKGRKIKRENTFNFQFFSPKIKFTIAKFVILQLLQYTASAQLILNICVLHRQFSNIFQFVMYQEQLRFSLEKVSLHPDNFLQYTNYSVSNVIGKFFQQLMNKACIGHVIEVDKRPKLEKSCNAHATFLDRRHGSRGWTKGTGPPPKI